MNKSSIVIGKLVEDKMDKGLIKIGAVIVLAIIMSGCGSSCSTQDDVKAKAEEMIVKFQDLAKSGDVSKIMALTGKMQSLQSAASSQNPQAACDAMDDLMNEL